MRVVLGEETVRLTFLTRAPRASDPVNVILNREGKIVNQNNSHARDVQAPRGDVRRDEQRRLSLAEEVERVLALSLVLIAVDRARGPQTHGFHLPVDEVASAFGTAKHDAASSVDQILPQNSDRPVQLLVLGDQLDRLFDGLVRGELIAVVADANERRVGLEERIRDFTHAVGPRRGEHERLSSGWAQFDDLLDLRLESHVQHPVRLVEDDVGGVGRGHRRGEPGGRREEIVQPPGRRD